MNKKLHLKLNKAWELCLAQRKWIADEMDCDPALDAYNLKDVWFRKFGKGQEPINCCYFCEYDSQFGGWCAHCPIKLVSPLLHCGNKGFNYDKDPRKFYERLLRLNKRRRTRC